MKVAVLGTGGIGRGYAAHLLQAGHTVTLWSPTGTPPPHAAGCGRLDASGMLKAQVEPRIALNCREAMADCDVAIVAVTGNGARAVVAAMAPHLTAGQSVIFSAHCSFAALYLAELVHARSVAIPIVAWSTTALFARRTGASGVHISGLRSEIDMAVLPGEAAAAGLATCEALFGSRFKLRPDILAIMLSNLNPPVHMASMIGNLTRADLGEDWANFGTMTPAVGRIIETLDRERLQLAAAFDLTVRTVQDHYERSFGVQPGPMFDMAQAVHRQKPDLLGPKTLDTRYITEDVPFGLYPLEWLGRLAGVPMPLHTAGIELLSAACTRDFRAANDLLPLFDLGQLTAHEFHARLRDPAGGGGTALLRPMA